VSASCEHRWPPAAPGPWVEGGAFHITARLIADYAEAVGEKLSEGAPAPAMFAVVYAAPAIERLMRASLAGRGPLIHGAQEFEWDAPVWAGDCIVTRARLEASEVRGAYRALRFCSISHNHARLPVSRGRWTILVPNRDSARMPAEGR